MGVWIIPVSGAANQSTRTCASRQRGQDPTATDRTGALRQRDIPILRRGEADCELLLSRFDCRRVRFEVCDVSEHPDRAEADAVCYTPMLVKHNPSPRAYVLGDL